MGMSDKEALIDMGFPVNRVEVALKKTSSLQDAITLLTDPAKEHIFHLESGDNRDDVKDIEADDASNDTEMNMLGSAEAKSLQCSECGKRFKGTAQAEFHASKSGHEKFAESTEEINPLTEEEKKLKLEDLRQKLAQKRAFEALQDREAEKRNETIRRKKDAESAALIEEQKKIAALKEVEKKKREREQEILAKKRIKEQIEADKIIRREKIEKEKLARSGIPYSTTSAVIKEPISAMKSGFGTTARLQFRMNGKTFSGTYDATETLLEVAQKIEPQSGVPAQHATFTLTFPKKVFTESERNKTLRELGLLPSAALLLN
ncbi:hypothetical protein NEOLI_000760 [Neolecta irregularis DAH-3]|uniref:UBX domain-containing protein n=1 Tax=Neolecta irregularis (strain DAH-3) TaxID=1198029 RepID=A0A1U7LIS9_NEOID|nr:hypothetical protein NEOLI_000760 [Neolecta irregularis DAH-3]|eukprot:OLL22557.1 hypothetical protein NEOLI_000760 [Neolecta irregularis DAH-3]